MWFEIPAAPLGRACIHAARDGGDAAPLIAPIQQSTTFRQSDLRGGAAHTYSRASNPGVASLERALARIEEASCASTYASGMAAVSTLLLATCSAGDHVVVGAVVYGGTRRLLEQVLERFGVSATFVDPADVSAFERALERPTRLVLVESPANPTLVLTDIAAVATLARRAGALCAVDNTFLTAGGQRPLALGAHVSIYSTTKFLEGHNVALGGALVTDDPDLHERLAFARTALGCIQTPFNAWLTLQGLKTLPLRLHAHSAAALRVAAFLEGRPEVARARHPALPSHPQHTLARRQQALGGGIVACELRGGAEAARCFVRGLQTWTLAENLGSIESLVTHPATMTHASLSPRERDRLGIGDGLLRLSVGLEPTDDLIVELKRALERCAGVEAVS